jgi:hypothetical protein
MSAVPRKRKQAQSISGCCECLRRLMVMQLTSFLRSGPPKGGILPIRKPNADVVLIVARVNR